VYYASGMDLETIREAHERLTGAQSAAWSSTVGGREDRALILAAVPGLTGEIDRLKALARDGWREACEAARDSGDGGTMDLAAKKIAEIDGAS
jgi:hypothetical protein